MVARRRVAPEAPARPLRRRRPRLAGRHASGGAERPLDHAGGLPQPLRRTEALDREGRLLRPQGVPAGRAHRHVVTTGNRHMSAIEGRDMAIDAARERRRRAAERYRPDVIDLLLVAEAPPSALDRFFYFEHVPTHDSLFRYVVRGLLGETPSRDKARYLDELRARGVFLVHLSEDPFSLRRDVVPGCVPGLVRRCRELRPRRVVLIGAGTFDHAYDALD